MNWPGAGRRRRRMLERAAEAAIWESGRILDDANRHAHVVIPALPDAPERPVRGLGDPHPYGHARPHWHDFLDGGER